RVRERHPRRTRARIERRELPADDGAARQDREGDERLGQARQTCQARQASYDHRLPWALHDGAEGAAGVSRRADRRAEDGAGWRAVKGEIRIGDDEIRESLENAQLKLQRERGTDVTIFSPRASAMAHHIGDETTSLHWSQH